MTSPDALHELQALRDEVLRVGRDVGEIKTSCAVLVERSMRTEQDVRDLREDLESEVGALRDEHAAVRTELEDVKRRVWMAVGGVMVAGTGLGFLVQFLAK
ncbi:hypothetical protein F0L17_14315 [Streptomyces sp. TRM43335]|uniref:DUF1640 domain-containing protein n=1 Tax=Streptomyces taklimakanensis TaxID=2569853 RepID=A0A6G2BED1_9ACTN|nr:hypothetical protein [Streptomyces taklimakanensis]MTE20262.1 hypothetical protein [Streptomyces taklimakanensis]